MTWECIPVVMKASSILGFISRSRISGSREMITSHFLALIRLHPEHCDQFYPSPVSERH